MGKFSDTLTKAKASLEAHEAEFLHYGIVKQRWLCFLAGCGCGLLVALAARLFLHI